MNDVATALVEAPADGFWSSVRLALRGTPQDYTKLSLSRAILLLAIPMVVEMGMESLFGVVDVYFVSALGPDAVATVGLTESVLYLLFGVGMGLAMAGGALVARRIGEGDPMAASRSAAQALWLTLAVGVLFGVPGAFSARALLRLLDGAPAVMAQGGTFTSLMLGGSGIILLLFVLNGVLRGAGDAASAMRVLLLANSINLVLDPCLIRGLGPFPQLGLTGAAVATTIGRSAGVAYQLFLLLRGSGRLRLDRETLPLRLPVVRHLSWVAMGGTFQMLVGSLSWLALVKIISPFGSAAVAGYTVALRIITVALLPAWGLGNAAATLVGQNLGAKHPDRAEAAVWRAGLYNAAFLAVVALVFIVGAEPLVHVFTTDAVVAGHAVACLRTLAYGYVFYAYGMVMLQAFNGAGDTFTPTVLNIFCFWLLQSPLAWGLAYPGKLGPRGVFIAITVAQSMSAVLGVLAFRRGKWKTQRV